MPGDATTARTLRAIERAALSPKKTDINYFGEIPMLSIFRRLMKNDQGATAIEYTLIASLIAVAAITAMKSVGGKVTNVLGNVANAMT